MSALHLDLSPSNEVDVESLSVGEHITGDCCCCCCCCVCSGCPTGDRL